MKQRHQQITNNNWYKFIHYMLFAKQLTTRDDESRAHTNADKLLCMQFDTIVIVSVGFVTKLTQNSVQMLNLQQQ